MIMTEKEERGGVHLFFSVFSLFFIFYIILYAMDYLMMAIEPETTTPEIK
jgi:hypothetical protein